MSKGTEQDRQAYDNLLANFYGHLSRMCITRLRWMIEVDVPWIARNSLFIISSCWARVPFAHREIISFVIMSVANDKDVVYQKALWYGACVCSLIRWNETLIRSQARKKLFKWLDGNALNVGERPKPFFSTIFSICQRNIFEKIKSKRIRKKYCMKNNTRSFFATIIKNLKRGKRQYQNEFSCNWLIRRTKCTCFYSPMSAPQRN